MNKIWRWSHNRLNKTKYVINIHLIFLIQKWSNALFLPDILQEQKFQQSLQVSNKYSLFYELSELSLQESCRHTYKLQKFNIIYDRIKHVKTHNLSRDKKSIINL